ncbi:hypothetical protein [Streptomyces sp. NPDC004284]|uniref:hypothetical protein n=1 Tax=Streptomyces sp. NPDC004284 TaxID=3364695 RepID=UPI0036775F98
MPRFKDIARGLCLAGVLLLLAGCGSGSGGGKPGPLQKSSPPTAQAAESLGLPEFQAVMPGAGDIPPGWEKSSERRTEGPDGNTLAGVQQGFSAPDLEGIVGLRAYSFRSTTDAIRYYTDMKSKMADAKSGSVELPDVDAAYTAAYCLTDDYCSASITFLLGSVAGVVNLNTKTRPAVDPRVLNSVTRMFVQRIRQAQQGQTPSAKAA